MFLANTYVLHNFLIVSVTTGWFLFQFELDIKYILGRSKNTYYGVKMYLFSLFFEK